MSKPRVRVPKQAAAGDIITIKTLISHKMETGLRKGKDGKLVPRLIINKFTCTFNDKMVFSADIQPSLSPNPYFEFTCRVPESGVFVFVWVDDNGKEYRAEKGISVS